MPHGRGVNSFFKVVLKWINEIELSQTSSFNYQYTENRGHVKWHHRNIQALQKKNSVSSTNCKGKKQKKMKKKSVEKETKEAFKKLPKV